MVYISIGTVDRKGQSQIVIILWQHSVIQRRGIQPEKYKCSLRKWLEQNLKTFVPAPVREEPGEPQELGKGQYNY